MALYALGESEPQTPGEGKFWVAPDAQVMGQVTLGEGASVWYGAVVRGDKVILPCDEGRIRENDRVLLFCNKALVPKVEHLFRVSLEYF